MLTRVLLVEGHPELGLALRRMLEAQTDVWVVAEAGSAPEALEQAHQHHPDIALVDGLEPAERLRHECPEVAVLVLSMYGDERYVARAMEAGASGYLLKDSVEEDLAAAIAQVRAGGKYLSPGIGALRPG